MPYPDPIFIVIPKPDMIDISDDEDELSDISSLGLSDSPGSLLLYLQLKMHPFIDSISSLGEEFEPLVFKYQAVLHQLEREYDCFNEVMRRVQTTVIAMLEHRESMAKQIISLEQQVTTSAELAVAYEEKIYDLTQERDNLLVQLGHIKKVLRRINL